MADCELCEDTGWVCESCGTRWEKKDDSTCCGAPAKACPDESCEHASNILAAAAAPVQPLLVK